MHTRLWPLLLLVLLCACQERDLNFVIRFHEVNGLQAGDRVFLAGREAGRVNAIQPVEDGSLWVEVQVRAPFRQQVTNGSRYTIEPDPDRPGRRGIRISPAPEGQPINDGAVVEGTDPGAELFAPLLKGFSEGLKALQNEFGNLTRELEKLPQSPEFRELERRLQALARQMREAERKMQSDILPRLQQEMERLREELEKSRPKESTPPSDRKAIEL